jgi:N-acetylmuramic acid 6-phosphate etherase
LTALVSGASEELAGETLKDCAFQVKVAIVALKNKVSAARARELLASAGDNLRLAIREP